MKNLTATLCLTLTLFLGSASMSWSADLSKGFLAYARGDYATALRVWTLLAEQGNAHAQSNLGLLYQRGQGVPQNYKTAVKWYRLAAEQGHVSAQYNMGEIYGQGKGVPQNYKTAVKWYRLAAEQGYAHAQLYLGVMYHNGKGVIKDYVYAHMWGNIASSNGSKIGESLRDIVAKEISSSQIETAQKLAHECVRKKYKGC